MATRKPGRASRAARAAKPARRSTPGNRSSRAATSRSASQPERRRREPETLRLRGIEPSLTVNDLKHSLRFYTDVLGFIVGERWTDGGVLRGAMLKAGACGLGLSQDDWAKGRDRKKGDGMRIWLRTAQNIDALATRIKAAGGRLTQEPKDESWGGRSLSIADPDGFHLTIYAEK